MADSRKPVQRAVAPEVPAPVAAPAHEWELALLRAHREITLRWAPLIGVRGAQIMHTLLDHTDGKREAVLPQPEIARVCSRDPRHIRCKLAELDDRWNLIGRRKRQGASVYVISAGLLPDFAVESLPPREVKGFGASPLFGGTLSIQSGHAEPVRADTYVRSASDNDSDRTCIAGPRPDTHVRSEAKNSEIFTRPDTHVRSGAAA
jgi:hypothetical protein